MTRLSTRLSIFTAALVSITGLAAPTSAFAAAGRGSATADSTTSVPQYRTIDLGTLGGASSQARAVNDHGQIVGGSDANDGTTRPFLWQNGHMTDLGMLGGYQARASAINNRGQVVGTSDTPSGFQHAFLWRDGVMTDLGTLGGSISSATGINDRGEVTGVSLTANGGGWRAFLWKDGTMRDIGKFDAAGINNQGLVVGTGTCVEGGTYPPGPLCAVRWHHGTLTTLGEPARRASAVNDRGDIIGTAGADEAGSRGFVWHNGTLTDIGTLGGDRSDAWDINDRGQVVGESSTGELQASRPFLWYRGTMVDLTTRGLSQDAFVAGLDERGQLIGTVANHAALFVPRHPA